jgi:hypothetical protein
VGDRVGAARRHDARQLSGRAGVRDRAHPVLPHDLLYEYGFLEDFASLLLGLGLFGRLRRHELYYVVLAIWIVQLAWSPWWLARFRDGPLEWLWRSLTYRRWQPLRRGARAEAAAGAG